MAPPGSVPVKQVQFTTECRGERYLVCPVTGKEIHSCNDVLCGIPCGHIFYSELRGDSQSGCPVCGATVEYGEVKPYYPPTERGNECPVVSQKAAASHNVMEFIPDRKAPRKSKSMNRVRIRRSQIQLKKSEYASHSVSVGTFGGIMATVGLTTIKEWISKRILVETSGRVLRGTLISFAPNASIVLGNAEEICYYGSEYFVQPVGTIVLKGQSICALGPIESETLPGTPAASPDIIIQQRILSDFQEPIDDDEFF